MASTQSAKSVLTGTFREFTDDDCPRMAAALSYYTVFALPSMLVLIITLVGVWADPADVQAWIRGQAGQVIGPDVADQIVTMVSQAQQKVAGGFSLSLILSIAGLLFSATGAFAQLQKALNTAWNVEPDPEHSGVKAFFLKRVLSFGMLLVVALLIVVALVASSLISAVSGQMGGILPGGISTAAVWSVNAGVSLLIVALLFATIFKVLPDAEVAWRDVWIGAAATAVLFSAGKFLIGLYIGRSNPGEAFGAAAALAILLVWVYYSSMIFFLGAEFTQVWARRQGQGIVPDDDAVRVVEEKRPVREDDARDAAGREDDAPASRPTPARRPDSDDVDGRY